MEKRDTHLNTPKCPSSLNTGEKKNLAIDLWGFVVLVPCEGSLSRLLKELALFFSIFIVGFVLLEFHCLLVLEVHPWVCSEVFFSLIVSRDWNFFWVLGCAVWTFVPRLNSYRNAFHATACGSTWRKPRRRRTEKIARLEFSWAPFAVTSRWWNNEGSWELQVIACEFCVLVWAAFRPLKKWRIWRVFNKDNAKRLGGICGFSWFVCLCCRICEFVQFGHWPCPFFDYTFIQLDRASELHRAHSGKKSMADSSQW